MQFTITTDSIVEICKLLEALGGPNADQVREEIADAKAEVRRDTQRAAERVPAPDAPEDDPWADSPPARPAQSRSEAKPSSASDDKQELYDSLPRPGVRHKVETPHGDRYWEFEADGAPSCHCGLPAARQTPSNRRDPKWARWVCPLAFGKDTYKSKCDFSEFEDK